MYAIVGATARPAAPTSPRASPPPRARPAGGRPLYTRDDMATGNC